MKYAVDASGRERAGAATETHCSTVYEKREALGEEREILRSYR